MSTLKRLTLANLILAVISTLLWILFPEEVKHQINVLKRTYVQYLDALKHRNDNWHWWQTPSHIVDVYRIVSSR